MQQGRRVTDIVRCRDGVRGIILQRSLGIGTQRVIGPVEELVQKSCSDFPEI